jgi:hypothetical protein
VEGPRTSGGDILLASPLFLDGCRATFPYEQELALDGLLRRAQSASYAPREPGLVEQFRADLRAVFERFQRDGKVQLRYTTSVFAARRRETQVAGTGNL